MQRSGEFVEQRVKNIKIRKKKNQRILRNNIQNMKNWKRLKHKKFVEKDIKKC